MASSEGDIEEPAHVEEETEATEVAATTEIVEENGHEEEEEETEEKEVAATTEIVEENGHEEEEHEEEAENGQEEEEEGEKEEEAAGEENENSEHAEEGEEAEANGEKSTRAVEDSDDEEFAGFGEEEINMNKAAAAAKKRSIISSDEDENEEGGGDDGEEEDGSEKGDEDDDDEEEGGGGEDGVVEGINKKKKKKHKREHHHKHHHKKSHKSSKKEHHHKKKRTSDGEEEEGGEEGGEKADDEDADAEKLDEAAGGEEDDEEKIESAQTARKSSSDDDDDVDNEASDNENEGNKKKRKETTDLEYVLNKQKEENRRRNRRKKGDSEELNDMDGFISNFINEMKTVANDDRVTNEKSQTAVQKLKMLPDVINLLQKSDYHAAMIDCGILGAIAEWLAPLPDRSLPNIKIREAFIDALKDFGEINSDYLKSSGIGKAVMFLYKHSKETKPNKLKLEKLIHNWSRPIFNLDANAKQLTKEERMNRDLEHVKSNRRHLSDSNLSQSGVDDFLNASSDRYNNKSAKKARTSNDEGSENSEAEPNKVLRPGDPGFCPRARVPMPSVKDYVVRPKSSVESMEMSEKKIKKTVSRIEKHKRRLTEMKRVSKFQRAVNMSVSGKF